MTKLKKGAISAFAALFAVAGAGAVIPQFNAAVSYAAEAKAADVKIVETTGDNLSLLDISDDGTTLNGFNLAEGENLPANIKLVIPEGVTAIADNAFKDCYQIISVTVPTTLRTIGEEAFLNCNGLVEVINLATAGDIKDYVDEPALTSEWCGYIQYYALSVVLNASDAKLDISGDYLFIPYEEENVNYLVGYVGDETEITLPADYKGEEYSIRDYAFWRENITSVTAKDAKVDSIGQYAFYECKDLTQITLPDTLKTIDYSAFQGCTALSGVTLPAAIETVGQYAFADCTALSGTLNAPASLTELGNGSFSGGNKISNIEFEERNDGVDDLKIGLGAFGGNTGISVLRFPENVSIDRDAFSSCTALTTVYLSESVGFDNAIIYGEDGYPLEDEETTKYFSDNTQLIIAPNYNSYSSYCQYPALEQYAPGYVSAEDIGKLTYIVNMTFDGKDGRDPVELERLAGRAFNWVKNADGSWSRSATPSQDFMPKQAGYSSSCWYTDEDFVGGAGITDIEERLESALSFEVADLQFYARYIAKPDLIIKTFTYDENASRSAEDFIDGDLNAAFRTDDYEDDVLTVTLLNGDDPVESVQNAATYTLRIVLNTYYNTEGAVFGEWETPLDIDVTIERKSVNIANLALWRADGNDLTDGTVYIYTNGTQTKYSYVNLKDPGTGYTLSRAVYYTNSIVHYRDKDITLTVNPSAEGYYTVSYENMVFDGKQEAAGENKEKELGRYEAKALLTATSNYLFVSIGDGNTINNEQRGVVISVGEDRSAALITKAWYVLDLGNQLVTDDGENAQAYTIAGWRYLEGTSVPAPKVEKTDSNTLAGTTFTLVKDGATTIGADVALSRFADYVNASMPAGDYTVTFTVPAVNGTDGDVEYGGFTEIHNFTVLPAQFKADWKTDAEQKLASYEARYTGGIILYGRTLQLAVWTEEVLDGFNPDRTGVWAEGGAYDGMYSGEFELKFNLSRMQSNDYYTKAQFESGTDANGRPISFRPVAADKYTVYYQLEAKNYEPLVNVSDDEARREYNYTLDIYRLVEIPEVAPLYYTGERQVPSLIVTSEEVRSLYTVTFDETEGSYISTTEKQKIKLTLNDTESCRWTVNDKGVADYILEFDILRANNEEAVSLNIITWLYNSFNKEVNQPVWKTKYEVASDKNFYTFTLTDKDGKTYGTVTTDKDGNNVYDFSDVGVGTYYLNATAKGYNAANPSSITYNWNEYTRSVQINIGKGIIGWTVTPNVMQWRYGGFNAEVNRVLGEASLDGSAVSFKVTYDEAGENAIEDLEEFISVDGVVADKIAVENQNKAAAALAKLPAGTYYLWASVDGNELYEGLDPDPFAFTVTQAQNYWEEAPSIVTWLEGKYNEEENVISYVSHFGSDKSPEIVITVAGDSEAVIYDTKNDINLLGEAKTGAYELKAVLAGNDDYSDLTYSFTFQIFEKEGLPWWAVLAIVVGTVGLIALVFFILHQKGVLQLLTGRFVLAMRAKATVDATIAAVRATKVAEEAKKSVQKAKMAELADERKRKKEEMKNMSLEERAAVLDEKAQKAAGKAERLGRRADRISQQAEGYKKRAEKKAQKTSGNNAADESSADAEETITSDEGSDENK